MADAPVRLCFPAKTEYLLLARLAVAGVVRSLPFGQQDVADLKLAVTEACANAVRHAYAAGVRGEVELDLVPGPDRLDVVVEDWGSGIPLPLPEPPDRPTESGGMGLSIIRTVVDELEIAHGADGRGTVVHMTKLVGRPCDESRAEARTDLDPSQV
jgi:serine/threonine-protein kinase RsbW